MTKEKVEQANDLLKRISYLETMIDSSKNNKCEFILFSHGNGSDRKKVCNDETIIEKVRNLIILENELKLDLLKSEFEKL